MLRVTVVIVKVRFYPAFLEAVVYFKAFVLGVFPSQNKALMRCFSLSLLSCRNINSRFF